MHNSSLMLAIDAGGTSTRATLLNTAGECLGYGRSGPGNPVSSGLDRVMHSYREAIEQSLEMAGRALDDFRSLTIAMAGGSTHSPISGMAEAFKTINPSSEVVIESDLLATYFSGTYHGDGYALVAGTGAVCARIRNFSLDRVTDGTGWLLGDHGSGYWIGYHCARAVAADLDGIGPATAMTALLTEQLGLQHSAASFEGRPARLQAMIQTIYALRPIELAAFAVIVFQAAAAGDSVAGDLLSKAGQLLSHSLRTTRSAEVTGPLVLGGSILSSRSVIEDELASELAGQAVFRVPDGLAGAALLALRHAGVRVDQEIFTRIGSSLSALRS
ncbi:N-acetylglucosamine kinase [Psychromicrobium lacuslunae]|uniref:ATPase BadF/BadG/BcrA/BcrD type domain-containing protein n=1 Tax=Psychromicrobium lacuslunae TaxID=1618207 RepID=A0A0D4C1M1_9MICC|nr:BadF/BadG/BcrA/BcrD ATPase family protein [Psychromicrobium lacuslunae]AJT42300.1 hypothetical protein UM93_13840 [Psychromicrobium lacuslunae]